MAPGLLTRTFVILSCAASLTGCGALPSAGPLAMDVVNQEAQQNEIGGYVLIDINERVAAICAAQPHASLRRVFHDTRPAPDLRIGIGDTVSVTIWEAGPGGLFSASANTINAGARTATIPQQIVSRDGTITIPYAGRVKVAGLRPVDVENEIVKRLQGKAIEPQAVVTISRSFSNGVTVTGEVTHGARIPLNVKGERLLDIIAEAGGLQAPAYESFIRLTRNGRTASIPFNRILSDPRENIFARPNDAVTVVRDPQTFTAFGGTGRNASIPFDAAGISLDEAIAKAGGLVSTQADAAGVFLLRFEPKGLVAQLLPERNFPPEQKWVSVVYRLNLRNANSFFLARSFQIRNKDILYVADSPSTPVEKVLRLVGNITGPVVAGAAVYNATIK